MLKKKVKKVSSLLKLRSSGFSSDAGETLNVQEDEVFDDPGLESSWPSTLSGSKDGSAPVRTWVAVRPRQSRGTAGGGSASSCSLLMSSDDVRLLADTRLFHRRCVGGFVSRLPFRSVSINGVKMKWVAELGFTCCKQVTGAKW